MRPSLGKSQPNLAGLRRIWPNFGHVSAALSHIGALGLQWAKLDRTRPSFGKARHIGRGILKTRTTRSGDPPGVHLVSIRDDDPGTLWARIWAQVGWSGCRDDLRGTRSLPRAIAGGAPDSISLVGERRPLVARDLDGGGSSSHWLRHWAEVATQTPS